MSKQAESVDAVVVGAGFSGVAMTLKLKALGLRVVAVDAGKDFGGVWNWNTYPGARTDSPFHAYRFSPGVVPTWRYSEKNPPQPEVVNYIKEVAENYDLRSLYRFDTAVNSAQFDESEERWMVDLGLGGVLSAKYFITAIGLVSEPNQPDFPGIEKFTGTIHHTSRWPEPGVSFDGQRVGVIGTGSSGIQIVPQIARSASSVSVFQRTPNYVVPSRNRTVDESDYAQVEARQTEIWDLILANRTGQPFPPAGRLAEDFSAAERTEIFEAAWEKGGFSVAQETFDDLMTNPVANGFVSEFLRGKIKETVKNQDTARQLSPDYPYGAKRPPIADGYLEAFNESHVELVDLKEEGSIEFYQAGVRTGGQFRELDVVVLATGFDASTGAFLRIDIRGRDGLRLGEHWADGPSTYLGIGVAGFPNMFMVAGPQSPFANLPPGAELEATWIAEFISLLNDEGAGLVEPIIDAERRWVKHVNEVATRTQAGLGATVNSWFFGANIEGKPRAVNVYFGGAHVYATLCQEEKRGGYPGFARSKSRTTAP